MLHLRSPFMMTHDSLFQYTCSNVHAKGIARIFNLESKSIGLEMQTYNVEYTFRPLSARLVYVHIHSFSGEPKNCLRLA